MKTRTQAKISWSSLCGALIAGLLCSSMAVSEDTTAFGLAKEGNRYVGEQAKDRVVQIRSEKSLGTLTPNIWYIVYRDDTATLKAVEVKFEAGRMVAVKRPMRLLEPITKDDQQLDPKRLKIDSDKAIQIAMKEPILEHLTVKATQLRLEQKDGIPVWKVRVWAAKLSDPNRDVDVGEIVLDSEDGKVVDLDVHPSKVD